MVLLQGAGDTLHAVRCRHDGIAAAVGVAPADLGHALELIDQIAPLPPWSRNQNPQLTPNARDIRRIRSLHSGTSVGVCSRGLILDQFVRLHRIDENASGGVAPPLAFLVELQRGQLALPASVKLLV